jgi:hypothetical protein
VLMPCRPAEAPGGAGLRESWKSVILGAPTRRFRDGPGLATTRR